jgi:hypothetical protein
VFWGVLCVGNPKFLGNLDCPFAHVQSTPAGLLAPDHYGAATWPLVEQKQRLPRKVFRSSIAWLPDWLSTLRRTGHPATTQDSLPAAGQALPGGLSTRKIPMKGFRVAYLHLIPLSQALLGTMFTTDVGNGDSQSAFGGASRVGWRDLHRPTWNGQERRPNPANGWRGPAIVVVPYIHRSRNTPMGGISFSR